jgi:hypothetical protein
LRRRTLPYQVCRAIVSVAIVSRAIVSLAVVRHGRGWVGGDTASGVVVIVVVVVVMQ